ncbi:adhesion G protein-coupled receptor E1-like [Carassius auratus]|uniref:Adhesion G protein-coupled receptor E1-like n=1 Tax=Carassius auratus TaxID=7957 RepID=A0A6P6Q3I6_CARAU|nr:adhesion G protein-coupled receptor E1-like [Carassius auratus]
MQCRRATSSTGVASGFDSLISTTAAEPRAAVSPAYGCVLYNETYICSGSQYQMYCNTTMHHFYYQREQNQHQYRCTSNDCLCVGNKDTCACYSNTSSCFCEDFSNNTTVLPAVRPVLDCKLNNDTYICIGAQYHMYCDTSVNYFSYYKYKYQNQYQYSCWSNNCNCRFNKDSCQCYGYTSSSCFCTNYGYNITIPSSLSPVTGLDCWLYNDTYICTGAQYHMYCNTRLHSVYYRRYKKQNQYECWSNNCYCIVNEDTCTCYSSTLSSCFCETYDKSIAFTTAVSPVYDCALYNDMYICTGAQYHMYCNAQMHVFSYQRYQYQNQYQCVNNNCDCFGNKDTCSCSTSTLSSCFCKTYGNSIALPTAVSPVYDCLINNDTYICTGAQYHMHCNTRMHYFYYSVYQHQNQYEYNYECWGDNCYCHGNKDTCTCYSSTLSSCFCETYGNSTALSTAVSPVYDCVLYGTSYICTGSQYQMYCNTSVNYFYYWRYSNQNHYICWGDNCYCFGNEDTCTCYGSTLSSCFCTNNSSSIPIPAAVSPVYDCGLYNDTYICTGAQYRMFCNTRMHYFYYWTYSNQNQYECWGNDCYCFGDEDTCTCYRSTLSSCFCETNIFTTIADMIIALPDQCGSQTSEGCLQNLLEQIENSAAQELPVTMVMSILTVVFNTSEMMLESFSSVNPAELASYGNRLLKVSEKLISILVKTTDTSDSVSFTFAAVDIEVFMVGPQVTLDKIPRLDTTNSSVDIDLIGIAKNNNERSAAVAFMSYNTMENLLKPDFFNTPKDTIKTMMSTVISATLPKTTNTTLTKPVNFTLKHIRKLDPSSSLSCVYWNISEWIVDGCSVLKSNSSHTVCSCDHLSTFALMQTSRPPEVQNISSEQ